MDMSQDLIQQIASMLTSDPKVLVKAEADDSVCPVSADNVPDDNASVMVVGQDDTDDYGVPTAACCGCDSEEEQEQEEDSNRMNLSNAEKIGMVGSRIAEILHGGCELDAWMEQKLTICRAYVSDILNALEFKNKHHSS